MLLHLLVKHPFQTISLDCERNSFGAATTILTWQAAMSQEFEAFHANNTWYLVPLPTGKKIIRCKWVHKIKHRADDSVEIHKA